MAYDATWIRDVDPTFNDATLKGRCAAAYHGRTGWPSCQSPLYEVGPARAGSYLLEEVLPALAGARDAGAA